VFTGVSGTRAQLWHAARLEESGPCPPPRPASYRPDRRSTTGHFTVRGAILALIGRRLAFAAVALINFRVIRFPALDRPQAKAVRYNETQR